MNEVARQEVAHQRKMKKLTRAIYIVVAIAVVLGVYLWVVNLPPPAGKYDAFASCIASSGATFYGAFWCPHCAAQKAEFGSSAHLLPYVECSLPDASGQNDTCNAKGIHSYPTWYFPDGSTTTGEQSLETLSQKTNCPLPQQ